MIPGKRCKALRELPCSCYTERKFSGVPAGKSIAVIYKDNVKGTAAVHYRGKLSALL